MTDQDYDSDFLIRLITHKLNLMLDYFSNKSEEFDKDKFDTDVDLSKIIESLEKSYELGLKLLTYNYGDAADTIFKNYGNPGWIANPQNDENYFEWVRLTEKATLDRNFDIKLFFKLISDNINSWWV